MFGKTRLGKSNVVKIICHASAEGFEANKGGQ